MVRAARKAGLAMARFQEKKTTKPSQAAEALAEFGSGITAAFNQKLKTFFDRGALRPLGTQLFIAAAHALNPGLRGYRRAAVLELRVLRSSADFPPADFPNHPFGGGRLKLFFDFFGDPTVALLIGVFIAFRSAMLLIV